ncbi:hypothetical protein TNCV_2171751 [Trichonephila clavipes]|nr:hypothetical protein TNCV_2171751 [Trichonephila clavipes]
MIPAYNKRIGALLFPFETGIHFRRKTNFFPEDETTKSYSGFEPTRLQTEGHSHDTGWATELFSHNEVGYYGLFSTERKQLKNDFICINGPIVISNRPTTIEQLTSPMNQEATNNVSQTTVQRTLLRLGIRSRCLAHAPMMSAVHWQRRLEFARQ